MTISHLKVLLCDTIKILEITLGSGLPALALLQQHPLNFSFLLSSFSIIFLFGLFFLSLLTSLSLFFLCQLLFLSLSSLLFKQTKRGRKKQERDVSVKADPHILVGYSCWVLCPQEAQQFLRRSSRRPSHRR